MNLFRRWCIHYLLPNMDSTHQEYAYTASGVGRVIHVLEAQGYEVVEVVEQKKVGGGWEPA